MLWSIISWIFVGLVVGLIARLLVPGTQALGLVPTVGLGIVGSLLGGLVSWLFTGAAGAPFSAYAWPGWILSILGAVALLWLVERRKVRH